MNILTLSLDSTILDKESPLARRSIEYGDLVNSYTVIVPAKKNIELELSGKVKVFGVKGCTKICQLKNIKKLANRLLVEKNINVISVQDTYYLGLLAARLASQHKLGLEVQVHGFEKFKLVRHWLAKYVFARAHSIRVVSLRLAKFLVAEFDVDPLLINQIPIYTDWQELLAQPDSLDLHDIYPAADFIFISVQRLVPVKNVAMQLKAMRNLKKRKPDTVIKLLILGTGKLKDSLVKLAEDLDISERVEFVGFKDKLKGYYQGADALLITSDQEGWGRVAVEALVLGTPVIMTDVGLAGEVVINRQNGLIVPIGGVNELTDAMENFINDARLRHKLSDNATVPLEKVFDREETLERYQQSWIKAGNNNKAINLN